MRFQSFFFIQCHLSGSLQLCEIGTDLPKQSQGGVRDSQAAWIHFSCIDRFLNVTSLVSFISTTKKKSNKEPGYSTWKNFVPFNYPYMTLLKTSCSSQSPSQPFVRVSHDTSSNNAFLGISWYLKERLQMRLLSSPFQNMTYHKTGTHSECHIIVKRFRYQQSVEWKRDLMFNPRNLAFLQCFLNPLAPSDWQVISPYNITLESNIKVRRIKEMINN